MYKYLFIFFFLIFQSQYVTSEPIIAAYYEIYSANYPPSGNRAPFKPESIDTSLLTDLYVAFAKIGNDFSLQPLDEKDASVTYKNLLNLKKNSQQPLKLILSVGGWNFNDPQLGKNTYKLFSQMIETPMNRRQFIDSCVNYAHLHGFDGIDIDWEYPGDLTRGGKIEDFENFIEFLKECQASFHTANPPLILSYATPSFPPVGIPDVYKPFENYYQWLKKCSFYVDRLTIMAYDYHGPFNPDKITGVNAPLNRDTNDNSIYFIKNALDLFLNNDIPSDKLLLGIPLFGRSFSNVKNLSISDTGPGKEFTGPGKRGPTTNQEGLLAYFEIADLIYDKKLQFDIDNKTNTVYAYSLENKEWISFDTPQTIKLKADIALRNNLKGVIFWSIHMDEYQWYPNFPNIRSAVDVLKKG